MQAFAGERPVPCHRDYGPANWLVTDDGVWAGVIDFEFAYWDVRVADFSRYPDWEWIHRPNLLDAFFDGYGRRLTPKEEQQRLRASEETLGRRIQELRENRGHLTKQIDEETLRTYERIRSRMGGIAFVASNKERCSACKMQIPHQLYVRLMRGNEILACEYCGRLQYWAGHFPEESGEGSAKAEADDNET